MRGVHAGPPPPFTRPCSPNAPFPSRPSLQPPLPHMDPLHTDDWDWAREPRLPPRLTSECPPGVAQTRLAQEAKLVLAECGQLDYEGAPLDPPHSHRVARTARPCD